MRILQNQRQTPYCRANKLRPPNIIKTNKTTPPNSSRYVMLKLSKTKNEENFLYSQEKNTLDKNGVRFTTDISSEPMQTRRYGMSP